MMNIYAQKRRWKIFLIFSALLIGSFTMWYTHQLTEQLKIGEKAKMEQWAEAIRIITLPESSLDGTAMNLINMVITNNTTIPAMLVDQNDSIFSHNNISLPSANQEIFLKKRLLEMKSMGDPITIDLGDGVIQYLYYEDSIILSKLSWFPIIQMLIASIFIFIAYMAFSGARKAEQNQVWVGMAKETAHQLGTPTSSLLAWIDLLKLKAPELPMIDQMKLDVERLRTITERFSKIGAKPDLMTCNIHDLLIGITDYLKVRTSKHVNYLLSDHNKTITAQINPVLFEWVIENICKNAVDAMEGKGNLNVEIKLLNNKPVIDISDTGKGIERKAFNTVFEPGYTTKNRGWGLGLSLAKRIIEQYHDGKIFVAESQPNIKTTFRIVLNA